MIDDRESILAIRDVDVAPSLLSQMKAKERRRRVLGTCPTEWCQPPWMHQSREMFLRIRVIPAQSILVDGPQVFDRETGILPDIDIGRGETIDL